jgi:N6-adenosine-specific RNA methylase IME4
MMTDLPKGPFGAILADPPWHYETWTAAGTGRSAEQHYAVMPVDGIADLPVASVATDNCALFCWVTWPCLKQALKLIESWGFNYKTCAFDWMKANNTQPNFFQEDLPAQVGLGHWTRSNTEPCLLATRGKPKRLNADVRQGIIAPRRQHSRKPDGVHERIERLVAGPYLELFARQRRPGWECWGNETDKFTPIKDHPMWRKPLGFESSADIK